MTTIIKNTDRCVKPVVEKPAFNSKIYNLRYKYGYDWRCYNSLSHHLIKMMETNKEMDKKTIDIGCGVGWFTSMYYFNISRDITGVDFSDIGILFHARRLYPAIKFDITDIYKYDYSDYRVAILMEVLEHVDNDVSLLTKIPTGCIVYATVPFEKDRQDITHVREYSINSTMERYKGLIEFTTCEKFEQYIVIRGVRK